MEREEVAQWLLEYRWAIIVIIVAAALFALGMFNPETYTAKDRPSCTEIFAPAKVIHAASIDAPTHVLHFGDDNEFLDGMRSEDVWVYCWEDGAKCGAFNNLGVLHWSLVECDV